jgi:hypothetical protein
VKQVLTREERLQRRNAIQEQDRAAEAEVAVEVVEGADVGEETVGDGEGEGEEREPVLVEEGDGDAETFREGEGTD